MYGSGFEAEFCVVALACLVDDVLEHFGGDAFLKVVGVGAHGFYFAMGGCEFFECCAAEELLF